MTKVNARSATPTDPDRYGDLEHAITGVRNMAAIVTQVMVGIEGDMEAGIAKIDGRSWETFSFSVYHLQELIDGLFEQYFDDCEANASTSS